jgi:hypothetical protein
MEFRLPTNLQTELIAYDPQLKALARQKTDKKPTKKSKYPLGNVPHLIPYNIIRESLQQDAIDNINANQARHRFRRFTRPVDVATPQARLVTKAIIYHYEQCWYAAWLPDKDDDYIYGYAVAFKDTATVRKVLSRSILNKIDTYEEVPVGRTKFFVKRHLVTKADIQAGMTQHHWRAEHVAVYYDKARELAPALDEFRKALQETIPVWDDHRELFSRMRCKEIWEALEIYKDLIPEHKQDGWQLTVDNLLEALDRTTTVYGAESYRDFEYTYVTRNLHVFNTPFFRKWMQQELDTCTNNFNDPDNRQHKDVVRGFKRILKLAQSIEYIRCIWPDCPIDYYQTHIEELMSIRLNQRPHSNVNEWLKQHMPVASFFKILDKYYEQELSKDKKRFINSASEDTGLPVFWFSDWNDTMSMLGRIINADKTIDPPKRWRLNEFHDYVQAESWKISNPNETLPQDLFPEPIKVQHNNKSWSFFQPHDTHQLAMWGRAVRNCVGSASGYAEGVRKKQHFIVLCMLDGQPHFTIQLRVSNGMMSVDQIRGLCNSTLTAENKDEYTEVFRIALQNREAALKSA